MASNINLRLCCMNDDGYDWKAYMLANYFLYTFLDTKNICRF